MNESNIHEHVIYHGLKAALMTTKSSMMTLSSLANTYSITCRGITRARLLKTSD